MRNPNRRGRKVEDRNRERDKGCFTMIKFNHIYQEDCVTFMTKLQEEKIFVDVIVTSPPYNMNKEYGAYKDNKERDEYLEWLRNVAETSHAILKNDGSFFLNIGGRPAEPVLPFSVVKKFEEAGYILQNTIHWIKAVSIDPGHGLYFA